MPEVENRGSRAESPPPGREPDKECLRHMKGSPMPAHIKHPTFPGSARVEKKMKIDCFF